MKAPIARRIVLGNRNHVKRSRRRDVYGLRALEGQRVTLWCVNYIYTGALVYIGRDFVTLRDAAVVYETGTFTEPNWREAQKLSHDWNVMLSAVESFGVMK